MLALLVERATEQLSVHAEPSSNHTSSSCTSSNSIRLDPETVSGEATAVVVAVLAEAATVVPVATPVATPVAGTGDLVNSSTTCTLVPSPPQ